MTSKLYKTIVGAFVVGGVALFTLGIILLGGGMLFGESLKYVLYFDGSVSGLSVGAPVVFRGVPMGNVIQISLVANARDSNVTIPVTISIDNKSFIRASGATLTEKAQAEIIRRMVERGLRARLMLGSLITGQYKVELDFFPNTPMNFRSADPEWEIPTVPSPIDTLQKTFARLPLEQMVDAVSTILTNLNNAVSQGQLEKGLEAFTDTFAELKLILEESGMREALKVVLSQMDNTSRTLGKEIPNALANFNEAMINIGKAADALRKVTNTAEGTIALDSPTMNDLRRLLKEASAAARALRNFADMLERNPEALLMGKQGKR